MAPPAQGTGRLYAGTSGFAYRAWAPRFYPADLRADALLGYYAERLSTVELNNTFYQRPTEARIRAWLAATPSGFRYCVKAQRGGSMRALAQAPEESSAWLTEPLGTFGDRLGCVLFRVPANVRLDLGRLRALLGAWPRAIPWTLEFQDPSWHVDEVFEALHEAGAALCATELPEDAEPPMLRLTGRFLYLRLRRNGYEPAEIERWADRLVPFLDSGTDAFVFFRHDETGAAPGYALDLGAAVDRRRAADGQP